RGSEALAEKLRTYLEERSQAAAPETALVEHSGILENAAGGAGTGNWHISLRFSPDVLKNGMDPVAFIRYL
uniref:hypothetical protein n=1 Tax=Salmonella enterica TaxID=28901 RepID=UPI00329A22C0